MKNVQIAVIQAPHGVQGQVAVRSFAENPADLFTYAPLTDESGARVFKIKKCGVKKDAFIVSIEGVATRNEAEKLKGQALFVARDRLPKIRKGEVYLADVVGLQVRDEKGAGLGVVDAFYDYGAGVFIEIKPKSGKSYMLPFKAPFVQKVDGEGGFIEVQIPTDWLKEERGL